MSDGYCSCDDARHYRSQLIPNIALSQSRKFFGCKCKIDGKDIEIDKFQILVQKEKLNRDKIVAVRVPTGLYNWLKTEGEISDVMYDYLLEKMAMKNNMTTDELLNKLRIE